MNKTLNRFIINTSTIIFHRTNLTVLERMGIISAGVRFLNILWFSIIVFLFFAPFFYFYEDGQFSHRELAYPDSQFAKIDGLEIHYRKYGQSDRYMILLHGFGSSTYTWEKITRKLSEHFTLISYDRPGFGLTERRFDLKHNPYTNEYQIELLKKFMDHFDIKKAILVGNSAGGFVALNFTLIYPEKIEALVLVDAAVFNKDWTNDSIRFLMNIPQVNHVGPDVVGKLMLKSFEETLDNSYFDPSKITEKDKEAYKKPAKIFGWKKALWELAKSTQYKDITGDLEKIQVPVIVIHGKQDKLIPLKSSEELAKALKNATLCVIDNCGHLPQEECPDEFVECLLNNFSM